MANPSRVSNGGTTVLAGKLRSTSQASELDGHLPCCWIVIIQGSGKMDRTANVWMITAKKRHLMHLDSASAGPPEAAVLFQ